MIGKTYLPSMAPITSGIPRMRKNSCLVFLTSSRVFGNLIKLSVFLASYFMIPSDKLMSLIQLLTDILEIPCNSLTVICEDPVAKKRSAVVTCRVNGKHFQH